MKKAKRRNGFTLVELLIVIVVIGVLSAMMMLSSTEAVSSAKAASVISNMRNLKTATLAWYADNLDRVKKNGQGYYRIFSVDGTSQSLATFTGSNNEGKANEGKAEILKYLNNDKSFTLANKKDSLNKGKDGEYVIADVDNQTNNNTNWYVYYKVGSDSRMKDKIASRASSIGLLGDSGIGNKPSETVYKTQTYVLMPILTLQ